MDVLDLLMEFLSAMLMGFGLAAGAYVWERLVNGGGGTTPVFIPTSDDDDEEEPEPKTPKKKSKLAVLP